MLKHPSHVITWGLRLVRNIATHFMKERTAFPIHVSDRYALTLLYTCLTRHWYETAYSASTWYSHWYTVNIISLWRVGIRHIASVQSSQIRLWFGSDVQAQPGLITQTWDSTSHHSVKHKSIFCQQNKRTLM